MILNDVMNAIGSRLRFFGIRVYDYPADSVTPPAAIVALPEEIVYDETYGRGMERMTLPLIVVVGKASDRAARDAIAAYAAGSGGLSIKGFLEAGGYAEMHTVRVTRCEFDVVSIAGVDHLAALFDIDIAGAG